MPSRCPTKAARATATGSKHDAVCIAAARKGAPPPLRRSESTLPKFYFDTHDGGSLLDEEGGEYPDAETACKEVLITLPEMARWQPTDSNDELTYSLSVRDESNTTIYTAALKLSGKWLDEKP